MGNRRTGRSQSRPARAVGTSGDDPATSVKSFKPQLDLFDASAPVPESIIATPRQGKEVGQGVAQLAFAPDESRPTTTFPPIEATAAVGIAVSDDANFLLPDAADFDLSDEEIGTGGLGQKYRDNIQAITILKTMASEGRKATPQERKAIARYVGWGALKGVFDPDNRQWTREHQELKALLTEEEWKSARASMLNAHYTSPVVVDAIYGALAQMGFRSGRVLEPSVGVGNFFGLMPADMRKASELHGVELEPLTASIAAALYPSAQIAAKGFQDYDIPRGYFDVVVGNPPFGNTALVDPHGTPYSGYTIHNYFFAKSIDKLRDGGLLVMVTSRYFMDARESAARRWISKRADLISAVRLPNTAFKENAGTEVVTDILVFQKFDRFDDERDEQSRDTDWVKTGTVTLEDEKTGLSEEVKINSYFVQHPENVLGNQALTGTMYRANDYTVAPDLARPFEEVLHEWANSLPEEIYTGIERTVELERVDVVVPDGVKEGSYFVAEDGCIMVRGHDSFGEKTVIPWEAPNLKAVDRMKGMIALRDGLRQQMRLELSPDSGTEKIEQHREKLNRDYDAFRKSYGFVWDATNRRLFCDDTEASLVLALEFDYDKGISEAVAKREGSDSRSPSARKADILEQRVLFPPRDYIHVESARDALLASLNYRGELNLPYMESIYPGKTADEIVDDLGNLVFDDPLNGLTLADDYLSGDVKTKLENAKTAAGDNPAYLRNVEALEKVIPADKRPSEINATLGAAFIPAEVFCQFAEHVTGKKPTMSYLNATGQWMIHWDAARNVDANLNYGKYGTSQAPATTIFQDTLEGRGVVVTKTVKDSDGSTRTVVMDQETEIAREKQQIMKDEWKRWLWSDPDRAILVAGIFNEKLNRFVPRKFDGTHLTLPGMSPVQKLNPHQKNGVWRGLQSRQMLLDHVVGAGKTAIIISIMMEMRRMGVARKPLIAVPNHLTLQWQGEFSKFYPAARVLAATPEDFSKDRREKFFSKIVTGDWDAIVIGHSSLKKIGLPSKVEQRVLQEQIDELAAAIEAMKRARNDKHIVRDMEKIKANLEAKMKQKLQQVGTRDKVLTFDELGIDAFAIDELHEFKNLFYNSKMDRVPGMGNSAGSDKAFDLFVKTQWMWETFHDKAILIGATGTPISNSMVEMFNLQRYMQYPTLKGLGLHVFDSWARQFATPQSVYEVSPSGTGYRQSSRLEFSGINALMPLYRTFTDTITLEHLQQQARERGKVFPVPKIAGGQPINIVAKRSPEVANFMGVPQLVMVEGQPKFKFNPALGETVRIERSPHTDSERWNVIVSARVIGAREPKYIDTHLSYPCTTQEYAQQTVVEAGLTPIITVDEDSILGQFNNLRELMRETEGRINALSLTNQANKAGLDYRLIDPSAPDFPGSKINLAVEQALRIYSKWEADKGTQLMFCDMSIPLSGRARLASKDSRVYVRDSATGVVTHKHGTLHTNMGHEEMPFFIVKEGGVFSAYDAASGVFVTGGQTRAEARQEVAKHLGDEALRSEWIERREAAGGIEQGEIDDYNTAHGFDENAQGEAVTIGDVIAVSGAQGFSVYDDIKAKLVARGIPASEVAFIHDYATPAAKDKLFKAVNRGSVRILLGSTAKMGAGTNVQERLVGLHHIDAPWRPSDLEQREGRIIRQGNKLYERDPEGFCVDIFRYATEQTYDTRRWQILEHKARMIAQIRNYDDSMGGIEDIGIEAANASDMKAAASGDPLLLEETKLRNEVKHLEKLQAAHADEAGMLMRQVSHNERLAFVEGPPRLGMLQDMQKAAKLHPDQEGVFPGIEVNGRLWTDRERAVNAINASIVEVFARKTVATYSYRGIEFTLNGEGRTGTVSLESPFERMDSFRSERMPSAAGFITRFSNYLAKIPQKIEMLQKDIEVAARTAKGMREQAQAPFGKTQELESARADYRLVQRQLIAKGPEVPPHQKPVLEAALQKQRELLVQQGFGGALKEFLGLQSQTYNMPDPPSRHVAEEVPDYRVSTDSVAAGFSSVLDTHKQYRAALAGYVSAKHDQAARISGRLLEMIHTQRVKIAKGSSPPRLLSLPSTRQAWQADQAQSRSRLQALEIRLESVRRIKDGAGQQHPKIEELADRKMRIKHPGLAAEWDTARRQAQPIPQSRSKEISRTEPFHSLGRF